MTPKLAVLALLAACVEVGDRVDTTEQSIVGGSQAAATDFSTVVALVRNGDAFCSGVLVDKDWVLTTASCFDSTALPQVRIGDANLGDGQTSGLTINVTSIHKHPQFSFNDDVWRHDVAVLALATSVTDRTPTPILRVATGVGAPVTQAGFGANNNSGGGMGVLRSLATTTIDCAGAGDGGILNANLLCFNAADGNGSCYGDGGAPAFVTGTHGRVVTGVASGGTGSSCTSGYDVYTSLAAELGFLDTLVPQPTTPPPSNPPPSDPPSGGNTDNGGSGTGSGSGSGREPGEKGGLGGTQLNAGCSATRETPALSLLVIAAIGFARRRRGATGRSRAGSRRSCS